MKVIMRNETLRRLSEKMVADISHKVSDDESSIADTASIASVEDLDMRLGAFCASPDLNEGSIITCDACELCNDRCKKSECDSCRAKKMVKQMCSPCSIPKGERLYTICQVRRHNHKDSAWLVVGDTIYDATPYLSRHPGGTECILKKAGGAEDCSRDLKFHSAQGKRMFKKYEIGKLRLCACNGAKSSGMSDKQWWSFW